MNAITTGPMSNRSYETLELDCLSGPVLEASRGNFGLAVAYDDSAFRFAADIRDVRRDGDTCTVDADVTTLDGQRTQALTLEADRSHGVIAEADLDTSPLVQVGEPQRACFFFPELSDIPREDEFFTTDWDEKRFQQLIKAAQRPEAQVQRVIESLSRLSGVPGTVTSVNSFHSEQEMAAELPRTPKTTQWGLLGALLPIRMPRR